MVSSWLCGVRAEGRILRSYGDVEERFFPRWSGVHPGAFLISLDFSWGLSWVVRGLRYFEAALDVRGNSGAFSWSPGGILEASCRFYGVINMKFLTENNQTLKGPS